MPVPKRIAAIVTVYHKNSHADVILRQIFNGHPPDYKERPNLQLVSLYVDQPEFTQPDLSRDLAKKHGFPIFDSIAGALTLGGKELAVEGVLSIGEHGAYPENKIGQKLYPRRRFFEAIVEVFETSGRAVPVFNDKHLSAKWDDAKAIYDLARKHLIPLMAGSSVPVTWRRPELTLPRGCELTGAVQIGYGPFEGYGFHALEGLQCMVERRKIAGTKANEIPQQGVKAVACHMGPAMWDRLDREDRVRPVLETALGLVPAHAKTDLRTAVAKTKDAGLFEIEYRDGLRAFVLMPNGWVSDGDGGAFIFAGQRKGEPRPEGCLFYLQQADPFAHFSYLVRAIDSHINTGHAPYPVERTLLTGGILDAVMHGRAKLGQRIETPHLDISYRPTDWPHAVGEAPKFAK